MEPHAAGAFRKERGFTLFETMIGVAILMIALTGVASSLSTKPGSTRAAAFDLQAAVAEARSVAAMDAAKSLDPLAAAHGTAGTGATVGVVPSGSGGVVITVYRGRPVEGAPGWPTSDEHFAPITTQAGMSVADANGRAGEPPFAILVTSAGVASIAPDYDFRSHTGFGISGDPGCPGGERAEISVTSLGTSQTHELSCREASYDAATAVTMARPN